MIERLNATPRSAGSGQLDELRWWAGGKRVPTDYKSRPVTNLKCVH